MFVFIDFVRALATCLITNSHFTPIYSWDFLAKGGTFGNSLFFLATGFCLYNCSEKFKPWYIKRLIKLYIPVIIIAFFNLYDGRSVFETLFFSFIFPANYWFVCSLVILYPLYYFVVKYPFKNRKYIYTAILVLAYTVIYCFLDTSIYIVESIGVYGLKFSYIFSFFLMLFGGYVRQNLDVIRLKIEKYKPVLAISFLLSVILYFAFFLLMNKFTVLCKYQFLETLLCVIATVTLFLLFLSLEDCLKKDNALVRGIRFVGNCTLEIYLVQMPMIKIIGGLAIPSILKFLLAVSLIIICAIVLKRISRFANKIFQF